MRLMRGKMMGDNVYTHSQIKQNFPCTSEQSSLQVIILEIATVGTS